MMPTRAMVFVKQLTMPLVYNLHLACNLQIAIEKAVNREIEKGLFETRLFEYQFTLNFHTRNQLL